MSEPTSKTTVLVRREREVEHRVVEVAKHDLGIMSLKLRFGQGWPDRLFLTPRTPVWIEFKKPGEVPTKLQEERLQFLRSLGYTATWIVDPVLALSLIQARIRG